MMYQQSVKQKVQDLSSVLRSIYSLTQNTPGTSSVIFRPIYEENVQSSAPSLFMKEHKILPELLATIEEMGIKPTLPRYPYWDSDMRYSLLEVFGAIIQFTDSHRAPLQRSVFPPQQDVETFIASIKAIPYPATLSEQFITALSITNGSILGAANLCWISTRLMARGADRRVYPAVVVSETELRQWNEQVARFEAHEDSGKNDGPGDNYYFWTHAFATMIFSSDGVGAKAALLAISKGTRIMTFVRNYIARKQPNMTTHEPASSLGRKFGLAVVALVRSGQQILVYS